MSEGFLSAREAAERLGISLNTLYDRIRTGIVRADKLSSRVWLVPISEVERLTGKGKQPPGPKSREHLEDAARILELARDFIATPETWVRDWDSVYDPCIGQFTRRSETPQALAADGARVAEMDSRATRWSTSGALTRA